MSYMKIPNLYKDQTILQFKRVWATEKIHGTSAWITYKDKQLLLHPGGAKMDRFVPLFDHEFLLNKLIEIFGDKQVKIHGEHYGGKIQKCKSMYGKENKFVVFEIKVGDCFLSFDKVQNLCKTLCLDVVHGVVIETTMENIDRERDAPSEQSKKLGIEGDHLREDIVLRPLIEVIKNNGDRMIAKHKGAAFSETKTPREVSEAQQIVLKEAEAISDEWVTEGRLDHVMDSVRQKTQCELDMLHTGDIIKTMIEDIKIEAEGEIVMSAEAKKMIGRRTAKIYKERITSLSDE